MQPQVQPGPPRSRRERGTWRDADGQLIVNGRRSCCPGEGGRAVLPDGTQCQAGWPGCMSVTAWKASWGPGVSVWAAVTSMRWAFHGRYAVVAGKDRSGQPSSCAGEYRLPVGSLSPVTSCELVHFVACLFAEQDGQVVVGVVEEVNGQAVCAPGDVAGVVRLREHHDQSGGADAGLGDESDQAPGPLAAGGGGGDDEHRVVGSGDEIMEVVFGAHPVRVGDEASSYKRKVSRLAVQRVLPLPGGPVEALSLYGSGDRRAPQNRPYLVVNMVTSLDAAHRGGRGDRRVGQLRLARQSAEVITAGERHRRPSRRPEGAPGPRRQGCAVRGWPHP